MGIAAHFGIPLAAAYRDSRQAGVRLMSGQRKLPDDATLAADIKRLGRLDVSRKYRVRMSAVDQHAQRLGLMTTKGRGAPSHNRKLPPDDVLRSEFALFTPREIANRHNVSYQTVLEARVRLDVPALSGRAKNAAAPSGMTAIIANAIGHLDAYRRSLDTSDPPRARALLADIEQLGAVAATIHTIAGLVAEPSRTAA